MSSCDARDRYTVFIALECILLTNNIESYIQMKTSTL